jgi:mRNA-degrading endonuclease YafQ of YafQ-DinJ toxin-antitoxin module
MIRFVHLERRFEKELETLRKRGEIALGVARKAEEVIANLTERESPDLKRAWKLTGWGEKRVDGCIKYDLGDGFRMICFRRGETLFVSYIGTHDECHNWLDHFSGRHNWVAKENGATIPVLSAGPLEWPEPAPPNEDFDDDFLLDQIEDKTLRKIFSGLVKNGKQPDHSV